jgi:pimeloyl-ACP methyl ester carboxylesterase/class 3 adenylate cyclase
MKPPILYAQSGDVSIAYQVIGDGAIDFIHVPGWVSHLDHYWDNPRIAAFYRRLASFTRLILFDKRGTGLSDRGGSTPTLEQRMDDVRAVMDAVGSAKAVIWGVSEGAAMSILFAATYPERTTALVVYGGFARITWAPDYACGLAAEYIEARLAAIRTTWGTGASAARMNPSLANDDAYREWAAQNERTAASPGSVEALTQMNRGIDARHVLAAVRVPTLVLHRRDDPSVNVEHGRYLARHIPGTKYVELDGADHGWQVNGEQIIGEIEEFLTGARQPSEIDRVLATVLFTDIVGSTTQAVQLGDRQWREMLEAHHAVVREELRRFRGREIDTAGDGFLAAFDGPARAIHAAKSICGRVKKLGLSVRAGLHTGECEVMGDKLSGIAVHIGARIAGLSGPDEVVVSSTVKDLVAGSGLRFRERGTHQLKGVPGTWDIFSVERD